MFRSRSTQPPPRATPRRAIAAVTTITVANLSVLTNDQAKAIRFATITAMADALECQPGDLLGIAPA